MLIGDFLRASVKKQFTDAYRDLADSKGRCFCRGDQTPWVIVVFGSDPDRIRRTTLHEVVHLSEKLTCTGEMRARFNAKRPYGGLNVLMLWHERQEKQYPLAEWLTYKQCQEAGGQVRKGEKSTGIHLRNQAGVRAGHRGRAASAVHSPVQRLQSQPMRRFVDIGRGDVNDLPEHERNEQAEAFFASVGATTR